MTTQTEIEETALTGQEVREHLPHFRILNWSDVEGRGNIRASFALEVVSYGLVVEGFAYGRTGGGQEFTLTPQRKCADQKIAIVTFVSPEFASWFLAEVLSAVRAFLAARQQ